MPAGRERLPWCGKEKAWAPLQKTAGRQVRIIANYEEIVNIRLENGCKGRWIHL